MEKKNKFSISPVLLILAIIMILYTLTIVLLFGWGFITSFKDYQSDFIKNVFGFPKKWMFSNYAAVIKAFKYPTQGGKSVYIEGMLLNTVLYALGCSFFSTLVTCITAYACGRFRYKFSNVLTSIVIVTMVLPVVGSLPSEIALAKKLHFYDNIFGMWAMKCNFLSMYYLVFYKTFRGMTRDAEEAAKIDGASNFTVMTRIMLPMVANAFATIMLIKFIAFWNEYEIPLVYLPNHPTLSMGIARLNTSTENVNGVNLSSVTLRLAGCMMLFVPIFILFLCCQKKLIGSITIGGSKES